jgi:hypothetical protein
MARPRRRKSPRALLYSKTELRRGITLKPLPQGRHQHKARICEIYPALPEGVDEILFDISNELVFPPRKKPS